MSEIKIVNLRQLKKITRSGVKFEIVHKYFGRHRVSATLDKYDEERLFNPVLWEPDDLVKISYSVGGPSRRDIHSVSRRVEAHRLKFMVSIEETLPAQQELERLLG